ncbi:hypothetical protein Dimus_033556 [Dionaea muscipula]
MVGRRSTFHQRSSQVVGRDSSSPDPFPGLVRGSPSPRAPRLRRGPPLPGLRPRRHRSPSPMPVSSPAPDDFSSSEDGVRSELVVTSAEDEDSPDLEVGLVDPTPLLLLSPIREELSKGEATMSPSSGSTTISLATATLLCQDAIADSGLLLVSPLTSSCLGGVGSGCDAGVGGLLRVSCGDGARFFGDDSARVGDAFGNDKGVVHVADEGDALTCGGGVLGTGVAPTTSEVVTGDVPVPSVNSGVALCKVPATVSLHKAQLSSFQTGEGLEQANSGLAVELPRAVTSQAILSHQKDR